ncbi:MAG: hypothetical protein HY245_02180 [Rhizobiales bacterium]|nr:hypothetical protein [Hyphomicrobiales bacterium]MBI3672237.1 hypothetical protein [Hyphomicrobiales bacterium]
MSETMMAQLVNDALRTEVWRSSKPNALLHESGQGSERTSGQIRKLLEDTCVICSMNNSGNVWSNATKESFFSSLKTE